jgi:hypothetical protein
MNRKRNALIIFASEIVLNIKIKGPLSSLIKDGVIIEILIQY